jgi:hypothetical protein
MDSLLIHEVAGELTTDEREQAIDRLLELGRAVDGLLAQQIELDIDALQQAPALPSPTPTASRFAPTSGAPTAGAASFPGSNTPTSSGSSSNSPLPARPRSQPLREHPPPESTHRWATTSIRKENRHVRSVPIRNRRWRERRLSRSR